MNVNIEKIQIKLCAEENVPELVAMNHGYSTDYVWQLDFDEQENEVTTSFRQVRLPRTMLVPYYREAEDIVRLWDTFEAVFMAYDPELGPMGFISLVHNTGLNRLRVPDIVINTQYRRKGIGSLLLRSVESWANEQRIKSIMIDIQSKNYPGISFVKKLGFDYAGFTDNYFVNGDVALFFSKKLDS